jgi:hypothetical protein
MGDALNESAEIELERERLRFERQKFAMEFKLKRQEFRDGRRKDWKELLANPLTLAIIGGL